MPYILRALREQRGISQLELACELEVSQQLISKWERGDSQPRTDKIKVLADFYGVTTDYIFGRETALQTQMQGLLKHLSQEQGRELCEIALGMISER